MMGKWWLTNGNQWKPMGFGMIWGTPPIFTSMMDHWNGVDRVDRCQLSRKFNRDTVSRIFWTATVFGVPDFLIFGQPQTPIIIVAITIFSTRIPHFSLFGWASPWFPGKKQKRPHRAALTARSPVSDCHLTYWNFTALAAPDVSLFCFVIFFFRIVSFHIP